MKLKGKTTIPELWHIVDEIEHTADMCGEDHIIKQLKSIAFRYNKMFEQLVGEIDNEKS